MAPHRDELIAGLLELCYDRANWSAGLEMRYKRTFNAAQLPKTTLATTPMFGSTLSLLHQRRAGKAHVVDVTGKKKSGRGRGAKAG